MPFFVALILIIAGVVGIDQLTKWLIYFNLPLNQDIVIIPNVLEITHIQNPGMAFGLLADHPWIFHTLSILGIGAIGVYLFKFSKDSRFSKIGFALIIGGGIGNMIDRTILRSVVDMIHITIFNDFFPWVFNVADSCVCVGVGMVLVGIICDIIKEEKSKRANSKAVQDDEDN